MCNEPKKNKKGLAKLVTMSYNDKCRVAEATNNTQSKFGRNDLDKTTQER